MQTISLDWWRPEAVEPLVAAAPGVGDEPQGGRTAFWAVVAFTAVLLFTPQQWVPFLSVIRINFLIGGLAVAAHLMAPPQAKAVRLPLELKLTLALVIWGALSIPTSYWPGNSLDLWLEWLKIIAVFWLIGQDVCSLQRLHIFAWVLTLSSIPLGLTALENFSSGAMEGNRVVGYGNNLAANPNDLALSLNLFIPITVALALTARRNSVRLIAWGVAALSAAGVIVTFSRGGFITLVVEAALLVALLLRRRAQLALVSIVVCVALGIALAPEGYSDRIATIFNLEADETGSGQARRDDTYTAIGVVISHPLIGAGLGQGVLAMNEARGNVWTDIHNAYLNYGVEMGLPGLAMFLALMVVCRRTAKRIERGADGQLPTELRLLASGVRISIAGFAVAAFFHPIGYDPYFFYLGGMAVALKTTAARQFGARVVS